MQTVVLAAGQGTRIRPLTDQLPKPMLPVAGRPLVEHTVRTAIDAGATGVTLVVGYEADVVRDHFEDLDLPVPVSFAIQTEQRGTADAVRAAADRLDEAPFVVLNGDALYDADSLASLFERAPAVGSVRVDNPSSYGVLRVADDAVTGVVEKPADPPSDLINTGAYAFPAAALDWLRVEKSERGELELTDVLQRVCEEYAVTPIPFDRWLDVGRPWELLEANEWKLAALQAVEDGDVSDAAHLRGRVVVEEGATVKPGAVIEGPVYIGRDATVGPNAYVRGSTYLGPETKVGNGVEVKNAVLMKGTSLGHLSYLGDSVLGRQVNFGAGTNVANLRHDGANVEITVKGERVETGRRKFGVVCGDDVKTGINTSLNAGVTLSSGATTTPGEVVTRDR
ncbi:sugar phosphate nucleotidyltransferase [Halorubrum gandharaense]